jgi:hypothetical protein
MVSRRRAGQARPDLLEPYLVTIRGNHAQYARCDARAAVSPGLAFHEYEFDVILHDRIRLIGLAKEASAIALRLIHGVRDLVPDNGSEVAKPYPPAMLLN